MKKIITLHYPTLMISFFVLQWQTNVLHRYVKNSGQDFVVLVLQYWLEWGELSDKNAFFNLIDSEISHESGEKIMTLAEQLREEGKLRGIFQGKLEGNWRLPRKMLRVNADSH